MKGYKFSDEKKRSGRADDGFEAILKALAKAGSGSGSDLRKKRILTGRNLSNGGSPIST